MYHDGGSEGWYDYSNVFNHVKTPSVFGRSKSPFAPENMLANTGGVPHRCSLGAAACYLLSMLTCTLLMTSSRSEGHGSCPNIIATDLWLNDSSLPNLQGGSNANLEDENGTCTAPVYHRPPDGESWKTWPAGAQLIVDNAGQRTGQAVPTNPVAPSLTPNAPSKPPQGGACLRFGALPCIAGKASQQWVLDPGAKPGDGQLTQVKSAVKTGERKGTTFFSCWQTKFQFSKQKNACGLHNDGVECYDGCTPSPRCPKTVEWSFLANGSITNGQVGRNKNQSVTYCLTKGDNKGNSQAVSIQPCNGAPHQTWTVAAAGAAGTGVTVEQNGACVDNNFIVPAGGYAPQEESTGAQYPW